MEGNCAPEQLYPLIRNHPAHYPTRKELFSSLSLCRAQKFVNAVHMETFMGFTVRPPPSHERREFYALLQGGVSSEGVNYFSNLGKDKVTIPIILKNYLNRGFF